MQSGLSSHSSLRTIRRLSWAELNTPTNQRMVETLTTSQPDPLSIQRNPTYTAPFSTHLPSQVHGSVLYQNLSSWVLDPHPRELVTPLHAGHCSPQFTDMGPGDELHKSAEGKDGSQEVASPHSYTSSCAPFLGSNLFHSPITPNSAGLGTPLPTTHLQHPHVLTLAPSYLMSHRTLPRSIVRFVFSDWNTDSI